MPRELTRASGVKRSCIHLEIPGFVHMNLGKFHLRPAEIPSSPGRDSERLAEIPNVMPGFRTSGRDVEHPIFIFPKLPETSYLASFKLSYVSPENDKIGKSGWWKLGRKSGVWRRKTGFENLLLDENESS